MPDILIRNISREVLSRLKQRASSNRRSLQLELHTILEEVAGEKMIDGIKLAAQIRKELQAKKRNYSDSADLIREDRER
ncbi:FitA-like ribbon-helix-helix domain-containing protein [Neomoorella mulderi]|uniref:Antitoxin FitA-like ribbon-helix-helix domain-containing protein n=1 Tax=Moorella mulderi DSM 14980 TaxID=1122241 RepID=A0A151AYN8_9FIRM|nr:hypothetical protein [Moorella mulderi]KYH32774.1 hypothetical protein MOMUL_13760 [Moorella mulderi DSM 14980]